MPALTSLRFVAAFAVLVLHYRDLLGPMPAWLRQGIIGGQYGVTFFFVLSGFILTYRYHGWFAARVSDTGFYSGFWRFQRLRVARIYPVYVLGLLLDTPRHLIERAQAGQLAGVGQTYWASWLLNLVGLQAWIPAVPFAMFWNTPAWSVAAEFFFYATFAWVCVLLTRRFRSNTALLAGFVGVIVLATALHALVYYGLNYRFTVQAETQYIVTVYNPLLRWGEFLAGCLAGQYFVRSRAAAGLAGGSLPGSLVGSIPGSIPGSQEDVALPLFLIPRGGRAGRSPDLGGAQYRARSWVQSWDRRRRAACWPALAWRPWPHGSGRLPTPGPAPSGGCSMCRPSTAASSCRSPG